MLAPVQCSRVVVDGINGQAMVGAQSRCDHGPGHSDNILSLSPPPSSWSPWPVTSSCVWEDVKLWSDVTPGTGCVQCAAWSWCQHVHCTCVHRLVSSTQPVIPGQLSVRETTNLYFYFPPPCSGSKQGDSSSLLPCLSHPSTTLMAPLVPWVSWVNDHSLHLSDS